MIITKVSGKSFARDLEFDLDLPERGIVLVTGGNGLGKSRFCLDAIAQGVWNRSLHKTPGWLRDQRGELSVEVDDLEVLRKRSGTRTALRWQEVDALDEIKYESMTHAQQALESIVGPFEVWKRTSVFRARDTTSFTQASDAERKRLLESLLGIDRFEAALTLCRAEKKVRANDLNVEERNVAILQDRIHNAQLDVEKLDEEAEGISLTRSLADVLHDIEEITRRGSTKDRAGTEIRERARALSQERYNLENQRRQLEADITAAERQLERATRIAEGGVCVTCQRPLPKGLKPSGDFVEEAKAGLVTWKAANVEVYQELQRRVELADAEILANKAEAAEDLVVLGKLRVEQGEAQVAESVLRRLAEAQEKVRVQERDLAKRQILYREQEVQYRELEVCETILGTRGLRATLLADCLGSLSELANVWLSKITGVDATITLKPYSEKKSGAVSDAISLEITGFGDGGYGSLSDGQCRRIDVAMLFALADLAASVHGTVPGTLFLDEITDAPLDQAGRELLVDALVELSRTRPIVVITHSAGTIAALRPCAVTWYKAMEKGLTRA